MTDLAPTRDNAGLIGCSVSVAGATLALGTPGDDPTTPYVLSGLTVEWGRSDTVSQPEPATAAFTIVDEAGDRTWRKAVRTGARVTVEAFATVYPDPSVSQHFDPTFSTFAPGAAAPVRTRNGTSTVQQLAGANAVRVLVADAATPESATSVVIPPRPFLRAGIDPPNLWDSLTRYLTGQTWSLAVAVAAPIGTVAMVRPVAFLTGYAAAPEPAHWSDGSLWTSAIGTGASVTLGGLVTDAPYPACYLGLEVVIMPAPAGTWDGRPELETWDTFPDVSWSALSTAWIDDVAILAPGVASLQRRRVFSGRITDIDAGYVPSVGGSVVNVVAQDYSADLANVYVGDAPWPAETAAARITRILQLAGVTTIGPLVADTRPAAAVVSRTDVDRQSALSLIQQVATSTDAVLRVQSALEPQSYLHLEDPAGRPPLRRLSAGTGGIVRIVPSTVLPAGAVVIPADLIDLEPVRWTQNNADLVSRVSLSWIEQSTPDLTERNITVTDNLALAEIGDRTATAATTLVSALTAGVVAQQLLARLSSTTWRMSGVQLDSSTIELTPATATLVLALLDSNVRGGQAVQITGIPNWTPAPADAAALYVEGGKLAHIDGCWMIDLTTSSATGVGLSASWDELDPAWTWDQIDPAMTWDDLNGVGA